MNTNLVSADDMPRSIDAFLHPKWKGKACIANPLFGSRLAGELKTAVVLVTHDVFEMLALTRRVLVLEDGHLAESGDLASLLDAPQSQLLRQCAAAIEQLHAGQHK